MSRKPRFTLPHVPQHVIQRGHNREHSSMPKTITGAIAAISARQLGRMASQYMPMY